jgi:hypothetical protein
MTHHTGHIHASKPDPFSPPEFYRSGAGIEEYAYYYQKGYRRVTSNPYYTSEQKPPWMAAQRKGVGEKMMEKFLDIEITEHGAVTEEIELICTMTGFRSRFLIHHLGEGFFRSVGLGPS